MRPLADGHLEGCGGGHQRPAPWRRPAAAGEGPAALVGEQHAVRLVGVSRDPQPAQVVETVMAGAQGQQVGGVGSAAVLPVLDVVHVQPTGALAPRHPAAPISVFNNDPGAFGDGAELPTD
jgi:hypothetical protein